MGRAEHCPTWTSREGDRSRNQAEPENTHTPGRYGIEYQRYHRPWRGIFQRPGTHQSQRGCLQKHNPWNGQRIRDLDISRKTVIILIKRKNKALIPNGDMILREGDTIILYTQMHLANSNNLEIDIEV